MYLVVFGPRVVNVNGPVGIARHQLNVVVAQAHQAQLVGHGRLNVPVQRVDVVVETGAESEEAIAAVALRRVDAAHNEGDATEAVATGAVDRSVAAAGAAQHNLTAVPAALTSSVRRRTAPGTTTAR